MFNFRSALARILVIECVCSIIFVGWRSIRSSSEARRYATRNIREHNGREANMLDGTRDEPSYYSSAYGCCSTLQYCIHFLLAIR